MADSLSRESRSRLMSKIRSRNTKPELYVRRAVWSAGFRYRLHVRNLPGTPDLVLKRYGFVIFVQGCFWHQHGCAKSKRPSSNQEFWNLKLDENMARDARDRLRLEEQGWTVATVWECTLEAGTESLLAQLENIRKNTG